MFTITVVCELAMIVCGVNELALPTYVPFAVKFASNELTVICWLEVLCAINASVSIGVAPSK